MSDKAASIPPVQRDEEKIDNSSQSANPAHLQKVVLNEGSIKRKHNRILVTGGCGFIGSHLIDRLMADENNIVICADNCFSGSKSNIAHWLDNPRFEFMRQDVTEPFLVEVDEIYHLACPASPVFYQNNGIRTIKTNVLGTLNMLGMAKRLKARFLISSTSEVYGDPDVHPQVEEYWGNVNPIGIRSCYDEGKRLAESLCFEYYRQHGVDIRVSRIFNCFPAEDHQLLTASGFMLLADVDAHFSTAETLDVACYVDGKLEYHPIRATDVIRDTGYQTFVEIIGENKKSGTTKLGANHLLTNGVNLKPTSNHRMWTRLTPVATLPGGRNNQKHMKKGDYGITLAGDMVAQGKADPTLMAFFKASFEAGVVRAGVLGIEEELGLDTADKVLAFCEFYGYWLADGWLEASRITFGPVKPTDWAYLESLFAVMGWPRLDKSLPGATGWWRAPAPRSNGQLTYRVTTASWFKYFATEYGHKYHAAVLRSLQAPAGGLDAADDAALVQPEDVNSAKWAAMWALRRANATQTRAILKGYRFGDGCEKGGHNKIYTSSARVRDHLVQLALHAGHTATWMRQNRVAQTYGVNAQGVTFTARHDSFVVLYGEQCTYVEPRVNVARECEEMKGAGTVWCVKVPTKDNLIMYRRVLETGVNGVVLQASRPLVVGNTFGPRMLENDGRVVSNFIVQALKGIPITIYGTGEQTRSFCYVDDMVTGLIALMHGSYVGPVNLGNPGEYTIKQLAENVQALINPDNPVVYKEVPSDDPRRRKPDITKAIQYLGWQPKVELQEGLKRTIEDFRRRHEEGDF